MCSRNKNKGLTLIELVITLSILAILVSLAAPGFNRLFEKNNLAQTRDKILDSISFARSEAIKRGYNVKLCASSDLTSCDKENQWSHGWIVLASTDQQGEPTDNEQDMLLIRAQKVSAPITADTDNILFKPDGSVTKKTTFQLCPIHTNEAPNPIDINLAGQVRLDRTPDYENCVQS